MVTIRASNRFMMTSPLCPDLIDELASWTHAYHEACFESRAKLLDLHRDVIPASVRRIANGDMNSIMCGLLLNASVVDKMIDIERSLIKCIRRVELGLPHLSTSFLVNSEAALSSLKDVLFDATSSAEIRAETSELACCGFSCLVRESILALDLLVCAISLCQNFIILFMSCCVEALSLLPSPNI